MASERQWALGLKNRLSTHLETCRKGEWCVNVCAGDRLAYANEIIRYHEAGLPEMHQAEYQTDILLYDTTKGGDWVPRVVIECKQGIHTHDALIYSTKATTHKQVHPYLRYGLLICYETALPGRVIRHGAFFDFMMVWKSQKPREEEWTEFVRVVQSEVRASRLLQELLTENRRWKRESFRLLHRPLQVKGLPESAEG
jgi:hypothetical protein